MQLVVEVNFKKLIQNDLDFLRIGKNEVNAIAHYVKQKNKFLGALSRVRLYYPPTSGGI